jgi:hypothetical protein
MISRGLDDEVDVAVDERARPAAGRALAQSMREWALVVVVARVGRLRASEPSRSAGNSPRKNLGLGE